MPENSFYKLLKNPFIAGLIPFHGGLHPGKHQRLLSLEEFQQLQAALGREDRERPQRHEWAYTGIIRCGQCGSMVTASWHRGRHGGRYPYYHCTRRRGRCRQPYVPLADLEAQLARWFDTLTLSPAMAGWYLEALDELRDDRKRFEDAARVSRAREQRSVEKQLNELVRLKCQGRVGDEEYDRTRRELTLQMERVRQPLGAVDPIEPARATVLALCEAKNRFLAGSDSKKRGLVEAIGLNPSLLDRKLHIQAKKPFRIVRKGSSASSKWTQSKDVGTPTAIRELVTYFQNNTDEQIVQASQVLALQEKTSS